MVTRKQESGGKQPIKRGPPYKYDPLKIADLLLKYVADTDIPILAEFAWKNNLWREEVYRQSERSEKLRYAIKLCSTKKEAQLEIGMLSGEIQAAPAIFSLKQLGWKDNPDDGQAGKVTVEIVGGLPE